MLEKCALPYKAIAVDIGRGAPFRSDFLAISPNNDNPTVVDADGPGGQPIARFQPGATLPTLAVKTSRFFPEGPAAGTTC